MSSLAGFVIKVLVQMKVLGGQVMSLMDSIGEQSGVSLAGRDEKIRPINIVSLRSLILRPGHADTFAQRCK